jgi:hypothetical protein
MVAAEQNRQIILAELGMHGIVHAAVPLDDLGKMAVTIDSTQPGIRRPIEVTAIEHSQAAVHQCLLNPCHAQCFWAHRSSTIGCADIRRDTDKACSAAARPAHASSHMGAWLAARAQLIRAASPANKFFGSSRSGIRSIPRRAPRSSRCKRYR